MKLIKTLAATLVLGLAASQAQAVPFIIDDFSDFQKVTVNTNTTPDTVANTVAGSMLGGFRTITVNRVSGLGETHASVNEFGGQALEVSNTAGINSDVSVLWNANGAGLGGVDLTVAGVNDYLSMNVLTIDLSVNVSFTLVDSLANTFTSGPTFFPGPGVFQVDLNQFTVGGGVDVTDIESITMFLSSTDTAWDGTVDFVETNVKFVPVPAPLALMAIGLLFAVRASKRS